MNWQESRRDDLAEHLLKYLDEASDPAMLIRMVDICAEMLRRKDEANMAASPAERQLALEYAVRAFFEAMRFFDIGGLFSEHYNAVTAPAEGNFRPDPNRRFAEILARFALDTRDALGDGDLRDAADETYQHLLSRLVGVKPPELFPFVRPSGEPVSRNEWAARLAVVDLCYFHKAWQGLPSLPSAFNDMVERAGLPEVDWETFSSRTSGGWAKYIERQDASLEFIAREKEVTKNDMRARRERATCLGAALRVEKFENLTDKEAARLNADRIYDAKELRRLIILAGESLGEARPRKPAKNASHRPSKKTGSKSRG